MLPSIKILEGMFEFNTLRTKVVLNFLASNLFSFMESETTFLMSI